MLGGWPIGVLTLMANEKRSSKTRCVRSSLIPWDIFMCLSRTRPSVSTPQWLALAAICNQELERECHKCRGIASYEYVTGRSGRAIIGHCQGCGELWHVFTGYYQASPAISSQRRQEVAHLSRILATLEGLGASGRRMDPTSRGGTSNPRGNRSMASAPNSRVHLPGAPARPSSHGFRGVK